MQLTLIIIKENANKKETYPSHQLPKFYLEVDCVSSKSLNFRKRPWAIIGLEILVGPTSAHPYP